MSANDPSVIHRPIIKACTAWCGAGAANVAEAAVEATPPDAWQWLHSVPWGTLASFAAFLYSAALLLEWLWKRFTRPMLERIGWLKRKPSVILSASEWADLRPGGDR